MTTTIDVAKVDTPDIRKNGVSVMGLVQSVEHRRGDSSTVSATGSITATPTTSTGTILLTVTITPKVIGSRIEARFEIGLYPAVVDHVAAVLFQDTTPITGAVNYCAGGGEQRPAASRAITTTSLTPITFTVRVWGTAGAVTMNDARANFGGLAQSVLIVEEYV